MLDESNSQIVEVKLIDFGSAFKFDSEMNVNATTPEYLAPEMLTFLYALTKSKEPKSTMSSKLKEMCQPWSFDVWALGVIIIEIITGFPIWLSAKSKMMTVQKKPKVGAGVFGVKGRDLPKILNAQTNFMKGMNLNIKKLDNYLIYKGNTDLINLLESMMTVDPAKRISPK